MNPLVGVSLADLNAMDQRKFETILGGVVEHSPWVVRCAWDRRPFHSLAELSHALIRVILEADPEQQRKLLGAHPELAGQEAIAGTMTLESTSEQGRLGLRALEQAEHQRLISINRAYRERFGFPLIIALRQHDNLESVFSAAEHRLCHDKTTELHMAIDQVGIVIRGRLKNLLKISGT
jgi:2-oxo-4-hydroxy-4-carboxy-5-ureidoimidazoline decarboxylase